MRKHRTDGRLLFSKGEEMAQQEEKREGQSETKKYLVGLIALAFFAGFAFYFFTRSQDAPAANRENEAKREAIAVVDVFEAMKAHKDYDKFSKLIAEKEAIENELSAQKALSLSLHAPNASKKAFDEAASQKIHRKEIETLGEMFEELREAQAAKRAELEPAWRAEQREINDSYMNAIFNLRLKIENADTMRLKPEAVELLRQQMEALQDERSEKLQAANRKYETMLDEYLANLAAEKGVDRELVLAEFSADTETREMRRQSVAQRRNVEEIRKNLFESIERQQRIIKLKSDLAAKEAETSVTEKMLLNDISSKAAKLAILRSLSTIIAVSSKEGEAGEYPTVINITADDLTKELIAELNKRK